MTIPLRQIGRPLRTTVLAAMRRIGIPGVAVGVRTGGEERCFGYGVTNIEFPLPVDADTLFQIGSTTKTYTATLMMTLVEEGKVDLDSPVRDYLPTFKVVEEDVAAKVRVADLFTHTAGWLGDYFDDTGRGADALRRIVSRMGKKSEQLTPLGSVWSYNNAAFYVAGRIIEAVTGDNYEKVVADRIFEPLGMKHSFFFAENVITHKAALGHQRGKDGLAVARPWGLTRAANPAGGIASTAPDQMRYAGLHLDGGVSADGTRLLKEDSIASMQEPRAEAGSMATHVGLSWLLDDVGGVRIVKHGGTVNGHMSAFVMAPDEGFAVTVLTNGDRGHELDGVVVDWLLTEVLGAHRPTPKEIRVSAAKRGEMAGRYQAVGTTMQWLDLTVEGDGLLLTTVVAPKALEQRPELASIVPPPVRLVMTGRDRTVCIDEPFPGRRAEFVRQPDGSIGWFRWGGRIHKRQP